MNGIKAFCKWSGAAVVLWTLSSSTAVYGQSGVPEDWSHHHAVFSSPGSYDDAVRKGTVDKWTKIVNEPRYQIQQLRRGLQQQPAATRGAKRPRGGAEATGCGLGERRSHSLRPR